ncbi:MAG: metallophosphoesterase [Thermoguttaceae bacterium]
MNSHHTTSRTRRRFLGEAIAAAAAGLLPFPSRGAEDRPGQQTQLVFGLVTDVHYADTETKGTRHYRDSKAKLAAAVDQFRREKVAMVVELGDLINAGPSKEAEREYLATVTKILEPLQTPRHFVLGNHCVDTLTKAEFLGACGRPAEPTYYSFDMAGYHFVILDADFLRDGTPYAPGNFQWTDTWIPQEEQDWLTEDLAKAKGRPTVVFVHQNLHDEKNVHGVKNAPQVRAILEASGDVIAVFQGHMHTGAFERIGGIPYCTLRAMVEGPGPETNAFAVVKLRGRTVEFQGFGKQPGWDFS